jgi:hypothetical protein
MVHLRSQWNCVLTSQLLWCYSAGMLRLPEGRCLHLVDVENLIGQPRPTSQQVAACRDRFAELAGVGDHVIVSCNHGALASVGWTWTGARYVVRSGPDGADLAILGVIEFEGVSARFSRVVLGSGDGIFAEAVARLGASGVDVTVVSRPEALSKRLGLAATHVLTLTPETRPADAVALARIPA